MKAVEVTNLSFCYEDGTQALSDVSLAIEENEVVGLVGPNGAGKSTLLLHLNGSLPEEPGDRSAVSIFSQPIAKGNLGEIRRSVGMLFQNTDDQLFCSTVFEDVAFGPEQFGLSGKDLSRRVRDALCQVGLDANYASRACHHLSQGEKRRVCLAGVMACEPKILVLDEPTSDLDPRGRRELIELLQSIEAPKLIASHDLDFVLKVCSRVIVLDRGRVAAEGRVLSILGDEKIMAAHGLECPCSLRV